MQRTKAREIYSASLLLLIGTIYLAAQADSFFSVGSVYVEGDVIKLSRNEFLSHLRTVITVLFCFTGGISLLRTKKGGWIISQSILLLLLSIAVGILISNFTDFTSSILFLVAAIVLLLLAIVFLVLKPTRDRFLITVKDLLSSFVLFLILAGFYFFLQ
jgi:hypothetical protein